MKEEFVTNVLAVKRVSDREMSLKLEIEGDVQSDREMSLKLEIEGDVQCSWWLFSTGRM